MITITKCWPKMITITKCCPKLTTINKFWPTFSKITHKQQEKLEFLENEKLIVKTKKSEKFAKSIHLIILWCVLNCFVIIQKIDKKNCLPNSILMIV